MKEDGDEDMKEDGDEEMKEDEVVLCSMCSHLLCIVWSMHVQGFEMRLQNLNNSITIGCSLCVYCVDKNP